MLYVTLQGLGKHVYAICVHSETLLYLTKLLLVIYDV